MLNRYASNTILKPMKEVYYGLKRVSTEMEANEENEDWDRLLLVIRLRDVCRGAMMTLNDLHMYEKIETCLIESKRTFVNAWSFVRDLTRPFQMKVI